VNPRPTVESLHDQAQGADRWRIKVRGELTGPAGTIPARTVWARLPGEQPYELAIAAHLARRPVRARGTLTRQRGRLELVVAPGGFDVLDS
jgi:hypothetical protein